jgi:hypothetical protein
MFQSRDVDHQRNIFQINGVNVFGGLPASPDRNTWNGNILLVESHHQLRATGNVLHIEARTAFGGDGSDPALSLMKPLLPAHMQAMEMMQKAFWDALSADKATKGKKDPEKAEKQ